MVLVAVTAMATGLVALGTGGATAASKPCAAAWPMFQHDAGRSGASCGASSVDAANVSELAPRWFTPTSAPVTAEPVVVGQMLWVGDGGGTFHALDTATGASRWTFTVTDQHQSSYGVITSSAAWRPARANGGATVYFGGGGSVYALDAATGHQVWADDLDPAQPTSAVEVESSPLLIEGADHRPEVVVGTDSNETPGTDRTGVIALDADTGALLWKYELETGQVVHSLRPSSAQDRGSACGDVWSSLALDKQDGAVVFGSGNCSSPLPGMPVTSEAIWSLDATTGALRWVFPQGGRTADEKYGYDDDFGSSAVVVDRPRMSPEIIEASKAGFAYALDGVTGKELWETQAAQPGQSGSNLAGAIGGFIGGAAVGRAGERPAFFASAAVPLPFAGDGLSSSGVTPDPSLPGHPGRVASLHAIDVASGKVLWDAPGSMPTYAPVTYSGGVVFAPSTTSFSAQAYDAATGVLRWAAPVGASLSSGTAVVGPDIYFGAGTALGSSPVGSVTVPPQANGIWSFGVPTLALPSGSGGSRLP